MKAKKDSSKQILALTKKLLGNNFYSSPFLRKELHRNVTYHQNDTINQAINNSIFPKWNQISENLYEVKSLKQQIAQNLPCQVGLKVYFSAKLHMLKFYYLFLKKYVANKDFVLLKTDTDSLYFSISKENLEDCIRLELKKELYMKRFKWMPSESCKNHFPEYLETKLAAKQ